MPRTARGLAAHLSAIAQFADPTMGSASPLPLSVLLFLLFILCTTFSCPAPAPAESSHTETHIVEDEFIVMFDEYLPQENHRPVISDIVGTIGWDLLPRLNPAREFPSDFAVIRVTNASSTALIGNLLLGKHIKHVEPQRRYQGQLLAADHDDAHHEPAPQEQKKSDFCPQPKGRVQASFSFDESQSFSTGRRLHELAFNAPQQLFADYLWDKMYTGTGVRVAVFDTGLAKHHPDFRNVKERTNWTNENTADDGLGHGTFVAGVIASQSDECPGFAPDAELFIFRVFTAQKVSFTSWFLDAFNYALHKKINILNLSIGGPDFMDRPFVEKVWELSANNVIVVSAIGNDGPLYGTLNNPADQLDVIGVGGMDLSERVAPFSSRGMTTWELPLGYGRVKPDLITYAASVQATRLHSGCRTLSGTSVASPVVAGAIALLASTVPLDKRRSVVNPASIKQVLLEGAEVVPVANVFEQGAGKLNLLRSFELLRQYTPRVSAFPATLDLTDCPYMWPHCTQALFHGARPIIVNITLLNGMGVAGEVLAAPTFLPGKNGAMLEVAFTYSELLWPWSGYLAVQVRVSHKAAQWEGEAEGLVSLTIQSPPGPGEKRARVGTVQLPLRVRVVKPPPRAKRLLWDQFHNLRYPPGYFPRDVISKGDEPFDWNADHPHTNFRTLFTHLRNEGYYIDVLGEPYTCFDASQYGTLLIVDPEEEFFPEEIEKLRLDVEERGLSVGVFADWYNTDVMKKIRFYDENTRQWWTPVTGGANVPALNDLLSPFGIAFADKVYDGRISISNPPVAVNFASGTSIARFPTGGLLFAAQLQDQTAQIVRDDSDVKREVAVVGLRPSASKTQGRIVAYGDSSCLDDAHKQLFCADLVHQLLEFLSAGLLHDSTLPQFTRLSTDFVSALDGLPVRLEGSDLARFSKVIDQRPVCAAPTFQAFNRSDQVVVSFEPLHYTAPRVQHVNGKEGGSGAAQRAEEDRWQPPGPLQDWSAYFVPYAILSLAVVALIAIALRSRRDRQSNKRMPV